MSFKHTLNPHTFAVLERYLQLVGYAGINHRTAESSQTHFKTGFKAPSNFMVLFSLVLVWLSCFFYYILRLYFCIHVLHSWTVIFVSKKNGWTFLKLDLKDCGQRRRRWEERHGQRRRIWGTAVETWKVWTGDGVDWLECTEEMLTLLDLVDEHLSI